MIEALDNFYLNKEEPIKSCFIGLREIILAYNEDITESWKYGMPVFCFRGKMFCYLWVRKKTVQPYIGIVEGGKIDHKKLIQEKRSRMKIMFIDPTRDIPIKTIYKIFDLAKSYYT